jgi:hypothetical protein
MRELTRSAPCYTLWFGLADKESSSLARFAQQHGHLARRRLPRMDHQIIPISTKRKPESESSRAE